MDCSLISDVPAPMYVGAFPQDYHEIPARIIVNLSGLYLSMTPSGSIMFSLPFHDSDDSAELPARSDVERLLYGIDLFAASEASFWHCAAGLNRSGLLAAAYLHLCRRTPITEAIRLLRERRSNMVLCNSLFESTLLSWYGTEHERRTALPVPPRE